MDMNELLKELKSTREHLASEIKSRDTQIKENGETNEKTAGRVEELFTRLASIEGEVKEAVVSGSRPGGDNGELYKSAGQIAAESDAYKRMTENGLGQSDPIRVKSIHTPSREKALMSTDTSGRMLGEVQFDSTVVVPSEETFRLRDIMNVQPTDSGAIEYVEETGFTNNAAIVPEGELKPESELAYQLKTAPMRTIAHTISASNQVLADANQLRGLIDGRLRYGVKLVEEKQILYGTGIGSNLQGLLTNAGRQQYRIGTIPTGDTRAAATFAADTKIDALRRAMTLVRLAEYPVEGIALHPVDWEDIELQKGSDGHYFITSWSDGAQTRFFRVPIVDTTALNAGEAALGAFRLATTLYDREESNIRIFEQHTDYARRNLVLIRAEERLSLVNYRPEAIVHCLLNPVAA